MDKKKIGIISIVVIAIAGGAFYGGMTYAKRKAPSVGNFLGGQNLTAQQRQQFMQNGGGFGGGGMRGANAAGGFTGGEIISMDDKSITVKLQDGGSKIIFLSDSTTISKMTDGTKDDLVVGKQVMVNGTNNSDGSLTAQNVQIRPNLSNAGQAN